VEHDVDEVRRVSLVELGVVAGQRREGAGYAGTVGLVTGGAGAVGHGAVYGRQRLLVVVRAGPCVRPWRRALLSTPRGGGACTSGDHARRLHAPLGDELHGPVDVEAGPTVLEHLVAR